MKWEYLFVVAHWVNQEWHPRYLNGNEISNWKSSKQLYGFSNDLGNDGWELTGTAYTDEGTGMGTVARLIFKRPKS